MQSGLLIELIENVNRYKRKYYINTFLKGCIIFSALLLSVYLSFSSLEYWARFNSVSRFVLLFSFLSFSLFSLINWIGLPLYKLANLQSYFSDEEASKQIGLYFPQIKDKLLNTLQLQHAQANGNQLALAGIEERTSLLKGINFADAIKIEENRKYLHWLAIPLAALISIAIFMPKMLSDSAERIIHFDKKFVPPAPFSFKINNNSLEAFKNEDFSLDLSIQGSIIPNELFILLNGQKIRMAQSSEKGHFSFDFRNIQNNQNFSLLAGGYESEDYTLQVHNRPSLKSLDIDLFYPAYTGKKPESIRNNGNLEVPEGTKVVWKFNTQHASRIALSFSDGKSAQFNHKDFDNETIKYDRFIYNELAYEVLLQNQKSALKEPITYSISVVKDQFPFIKAEDFKDSSLFNYITIGGFCSDDYGLKKIQLNFQVISDQEQNNEKKYQKISLENINNSLNHTILYNWQIDSLNLSPGSKILYYLEVWDNDEVHGSKSSRSQIFSLKIPGQKELEQKLEISSSETSEKIESLGKQSRSLQKEIKDLKDKIRSKKDLQWQDKKKLEELLKEQQNLMKDMEALKKMNEDLQKMEEKFNAPSPELLEKMKQLQKLMDEMMDEETKKLYEELQKMMEKQVPKEELDKLLDKMEFKDEELQKNLDRSLELFKELKVEQHLENNIRKLDEMQKKEEDLSKKSLDKESNGQELKQEQEKLNQDFKDLEKEQKELQELNKELENPKNMEPSDQEMQDIDKDMGKSSEELDQGNKKGASKSQKSASEKMGELKKKMEAMKSAMDGAEAEANIEGVRQLLQNLIKLSFEEETLMKSFRNISQTDPKYIELTHKQIELKEDSKMINDSLFSLSKKAFEIQAYVSKEAHLMNKYLDESIESLKARNPTVASGKQQLAMTSINNLALLLSDILKQMQEEQMADQPNDQPGSSSCKKPGKKKPKPGSMGDLQKQLNQQIESLKKGDSKGGKQMSESLAKMAAQQEMIRKAMKEMEKMMQEGGQNPGNQLKELNRLMEESEKDLVNKNISPEMLRRQQEILTRLLEAEKSLRERDTDENRESKFGKELARDLPPSFEKYLKAKEKQVELLQLNPPKYTPYYKDKVNEYFRMTEK